MPPLDLKAALTSLSGVVAGMDHEVDLDELVKSLAEQHLDRLLAQAGAYFADPEIRRAAQGRIEGRWWDRHQGADPDRARDHRQPRDAVRPVRLVDHRFRDHGFTRWPETSSFAASILNRKTVSAVSPVASHAWTNVRNADDPACVHLVAERFAGRVVDRPVSNGHRVHDPEPYLNNPVAGGAVAQALGGD